MNDLRKLLTVSELTERRAFIRSFVQNIKVVGDEATLTYVMPLNGLIEQKMGVTFFGVNRPASRSKSATLTD